MHISAWCLSLTFCCQRQLLYYKVFMCRCHIDSNKSSTSSPLVSKRPTKSNLKINKSNLTERSINRVCTEMQVLTRSSPVPALCSHELPSTLSRDDLTDVFPTQPPLLHHSPYLIILRVSSYLFKHNCYSIHVNSKNTGFLITKLGVAKKQGLVVKFSHSQPRELSNCL